MLEYMISTVRIMCTRIRPLKIIKLFVILIIFYVIIKVLTAAGLYRGQRTQKEFNYILNKGLNMFGGSQYIRNLPYPYREYLDSRNETIQEVKLDRKINIENYLHQNIEETNGVIYILESPFLSDPIESFRPFIRLQKLASRYNYLTVLPQVEDGYYFTLDCTFRSGRVSKPLPISSYFNLDKLQHILMSYNLKSFIPKEYAKNVVFPDLVVVFFIYDHDIIEFPKSPKNTKAKQEEFHKEYNYIHRHTIFKQNNDNSYSKSCNNHLEEMASCIRDELHHLTDGVYTISHVWCLDAKRPISPDSFFDELQLSQNGSTVVFINWNGYQHAAQSQLEDKLTFNQPVHDHILIIPFSDLVTKATEQYLSNLWFPYYSYLTAVIDLNALMDLKIALSTHEFNICLDKLQNNLKYLHYYRLIVTNAFHPSSLELDNYTAKTLYELIWSKFSNGYTPMVDSHTNLIHPITDMGLSYLIDVNLIRFGGAAVVFSPISRSRSIYSYYYDNHVHDFSATFQEFDC